MQLLSKRKKKKEEKTESAQFITSQICFVYFGLVRAMPAFKATL
jgi:hypothetical protein